LALRPRKLTNATEAISDRPFADWSGAIARDGQIRQLARHRAAGRD
jgi:hypothetical protein